MVELAACMFQGSDTSERLAVAHDADHCTVGIRSRLTLNEEIAHQKAELRVTLAKASGHQASGHNCGPGTENCGPEPKNLALGVFECQFPVQFLVEHRGFEPRTPCLPGKIRCAVACRGLPFELGCGRSVPLIPAPCRRNCGINCGTLAPRPGCRRRGWATNNLNLETRHPSMSIIGPNVALSLQESIKISHEHMRTAQRLIAVQPSPLRQTAPATF
jgi:hypothetical protein